MSLATIDPENAKQLLEGGAILVDLREANGAMKSNEPSHRDCLA